MGLDLVLGVIVLLAAIRGWLKGFLLQAIRLSGLVACVYVADPVRDLVKPYVVPYLPSIRPELVDRLLWWTAAAVSYVVLVGLATLIANYSRRRAFGLADPRRNDQYAGFALGAFKAWGRSRVWSWRSSWWPDSSDSRSIGSRVLAGRSSRFSPRRPSSGTHSFSPSRGSGHRGR
jgi:hypothetical protein